ncbi:hypothetical protein [Bremerella sp.]|uniref:hypothetical protein n=1 Tax=Bremerella sp. TaxID=2795602 RepID=UPI003918FF0C
MDSLLHDTPERPEPAPLRPSALLIVVSVINMVVGVAAAAMALVVLELLWPHSLSYSSILLLGWALITIVGQYLGTFRQNAKGAWLSAIGSAICGMMLYLSVVILRIFTTDLTTVTPTEILGDERKVVWIAIGTLTVTSLWFNGQWAVQLKRRAATQQSWKPISISLREILAACVLLGIIMVPASYRAQSNPSTFRAEVTASEAPFPLPKSVQSITYQRDRNGLLLASYEVDEADFRQWLSRKDSPWFQQGQRWKEITTSVNVTPPQKDRLPWSLNEHTERVDKGFQAYWQADGIDHILTYNRMTGTAYYEQTLIPE